MPRRRKILRQVLAKDPIYHDVFVTKLVHSVMQGGKKSLAERIIYDALETVKKRSESGDPMEVLRMAMENTKPVLEVKSRRVGGATYQVPVEVRPHRQTALCVRWLIGFAKKRDGKSMQDKLAAEILDASQNRGGAVKRREDMQKMAEANKAFVHYRW
ncbi:MAG: 30S ribosomal protein S7 [Candidatus Coatesbacteria bacterium]|nr:30S ribosomal protein S7 [Candidatus Coatesbacteria bacterium]